VPETGPSQPRRLPDFVIIGAMKSATTTLHKQLARQPGVVMSRPKEPNFFSDDRNYARGLDWYADHFADPAPGDLCGESSTHYSKLPTHPRAARRLARTLPAAKLLYLMRHPVDRLVSHYVHERTTGRVSGGIEAALDECPSLVDYGLYAMQLRPYLDAYGPAGVLPVFFDRLVRHPQAELERICRYLGYAGVPRWDHGMKPQNVGRDRLRRSALREALVQAPVLGPIRRWVLPRSWSESLKDYWKARIDPPSLPPALLDRLRNAFDPDLAALGEWVGLPLTCDNFSEVTREALPNVERVHAHAAVPPPETGCDSLGR